MNHEILDALMPKKPETKEEIELDLQQNPNRGKINGEEVAKITTSEMSIFIDGDLYNRLILIRGALGMTKSQLAQQSVFMAWGYLRQNNPIDSNLIIDGKSNFRGNVPSYLYKRVINLGASKGLDKRQVTYLGLSLLAYDSNIQKEYEDFVEIRSRELNCHPDKIPDALYGLSKSLSRKERLKLLQKGDPQGKAPKMNI